MAAALQHLAAGGDAPLRDVAHKLRGGILCHIIPAVAAGGKAGAAVCQGKKRAAVHHMVQIGAFLHDVQIRFGIILPHHADADVVIRHEIVLLCGLCNIRRRRVFGHFPVFHFLASSLRCSDVSTIADIPAFCNAERQNGLPERGRPGSHTLPRLRSAAVSVSFMLPVR